MIRLVDLTVEVLRTCNGVTIDPSFSVTAAVRVLVIGAALIVVVTAILLVYVLVV